MTEKDDPSRVAFGGNGHGGPDLPRRSHTGNGANRNGTLAGPKLAFPDSTSDGARSSKLGQLILDTLDRGVIALDLDGVVIDANADAQRILEAGDSMRLCAGRLEFHDLVSTAAWHTCYRHWLWVPSWPPGSLRSCRRRTVAGRAEYLFPPCHLQRVAQKSPYW